MDEIGAAIARLAAGHVQRQEIKAGDVIGEDGIPVCGECGEPRRKYIDYQGQKILVTRMCRCEREEEAKRELEEVRRKNDEDMAYRKRWSLLDDALADASFAKWRVEPSNEVNYKKCRDYADRFEEYANDNIGLMFWGEVGTGKSYAAACIANELMKKGFRVVATSLVKVLATAQDNEEFAGMMNRVKTADLVILDDLGAERRTDYALERVYDVIDSRYRLQKPLIVTTNLQFADMKAETDTRYQRIYDRVFEMCVPVEFAGQSYRKIEANDRFRTMKQRWREAGIV